MLAATKGRADVVSLLLAAGADAHMAAEDGGTAVVYAHRGDHEAVVDALVEAGALRPSDSFRRGSIRRSSVRRVRPARARNRTQRAIITKRPLSLSFLPLDHQPAQWRFNWAEWELLVR